MVVFSCENPAIPYRNLGGPWEEPELDQRSRDHHYVPIWYQKGFLDEGKTTFKILDLYPDEFRDETGKVRGKANPILDRGPKAWFFEPDLYTIRMLGRRDDVIERMLFGEIDRKGKIAIDALLAEDYDQMHFTYYDAFEFLDALRLRTPKGLRFVRQISKADSQQDLMIRMQQMRRMHCLMWMEGSREIFSADSSSVKFLFSDHPVTYFNRHVSPGDPVIPKGFDPPLEWKGTQTLYPFDKNRLLVLTHNEWGRAKVSSRMFARLPRTNARYFDNTLVSYHDIERSRSLSEQEVLEVNHIIKSRAERYIAGRSVDDLFPEKHLKTTAWNKLATSLMPLGYNCAPQVGFSAFGMTNGSYIFQDEFGRRPKSRAEWESAKARAEEMRAHVHGLLAKEKRAEDPNE